MVKHTRVIHPITLLTITVILNILLVFTLLPSKQSVAWIQAHLPKAGLMPTAFQSRFKAIMILLGVLDTLHVVFIICAKRLFMTWNEIST